MEYNINILIALKELVTRYYFLIEDICQIGELEDLALDEMISSKEEEVMELIALINDIDMLLCALTQDLRDSIDSYSEGFDCQDFSTWNMNLMYDPMSLVGLVDTFSKSLKRLDFYVLETLRGYRILTQPAYNQESLKKVHDKYHKKGKSQ